MKIYLYTISAITHAYASGRTIWCESTEEGFSCVRPVSSRKASRSVWSFIHNSPERKGWYVERKTPIFYFQNLDVKHLIIPIAKS